MTTDNIPNTEVVLTGTVETDLKFNHEVYGEGFYSFVIRVMRLSDISDLINVTISERLLQDISISRGDTVCVTGQFRSYNNYTENGNRLIVSAFAKEISLSEDGNHENDLELFGTLCKDPVYRKTPLGREICDLMLAINRRYGRSDYLPAIVWGQNARRAAELNVGNTVNILGRLQSREYIKLVDGIETVRTTYEVSVSAFEKVM